MPTLDPITGREFAVEVVSRLRAAGFDALWAGGCVRDQLMGREPKDYDVATAATPEQIRDVFGRRRTMAIGAAFGVITVVGPRGAGQIDVATFRKDSAYSDGRHPDSVTFSTAWEDAQRRDFTINGLFYDPLKGEVIDYVGGQDDLRQSRLRAIGSPRERFQEDRLRMLRAVRFATTLSFDIEAETFRAIQEAAPGIRLVSAERIAEELRRMLVHPARHRALELLRFSRLLPEVLPAVAGVFPETEPTDPPRAQAWDQTVRTLERLSQPTFAAALAVVVRETFVRPEEGPELVQELANDLKLANDERDSLLFVLTKERVVRQASSVPWPVLQRVLTSPRVAELLTFAEAVAEVLDGGVQEIRFCREKLELPPERLNPVPLITGENLKDLGIPAGPVYRHLLEQARDAQLTGLLQTTEQALDWVRTRWLRDGSQP